MTWISTLPLSATTPPLDPSAQQARAQLERELGNPQYAAAQPNWISIIVQDIEKWFESLFSGVQIGGGVDLTPILIIVAALILVALGVVGYFVFGRPRLNARRKKAGSLFGDEDDRDAQSLRRDAERAAAAGDFTAAIEDAFRAIARGLSERTVLSTFPGTTAHGFASEAATAFPPFARSLRDAANAFDAVRYLGRTGTREEWVAVSELERELRAARPVLDEVSA